MDEKMKDLLIEYLDGNLSGELLEFVEKQLSKSEEVNTEYQRLIDLSNLMSNTLEVEPDSLLKSDFLLAIEEELEEANGSAQEIKKKSFNWLVSLKVAASVAIVALSFMAGRWLWHKQIEDERLLTLENKLIETKKLVFTSLEDQASASTRLKGVNMAYNNQSIDAEVIRILIKTMNDDESVNVRLAAVQALAKFSDEPGVTAALIHALEHQKEPLVQIVLINLMVELKEKEAIEELEQIITDEESIQTVKNEAHMALFKLY